MKRGLVIAMLITILSIGLVFVVDLLLSGCAATYDPSTGNISIGPDGKQIVDGFAEWQYLKAHPIHTDK